VEVLRARGSPGLSLAPSPSLRAALEPPPPALLPSLWEESPWEARNCVWPREPCEAAWAPLNLPQQLMAPGVTVGVRPAPRGRSVEGDPGFDPVVRFWGCGVQWFRSQGVNFTHYLYICQALNAIFAHVPTSLL